MMLKKQNPGKMCIRDSAIAESDVRYALIIWIKPFHPGISQGVLFKDYKDLNTQIMLSRCLLYTSID